MERHSMLRIFFGILMIYALFMNPAPNSSMALNHFHLAISLIDENTIELPSDFDIEVAEKDGKRYSGLPPGAGFLASIIYKIFRPLFPLNRSSETIYLLNILTILFLSSPLAAFAMIAYLKIIPKISFDKDEIFWSFAIAAFGTMSFAYAGGYYKKGIAGSLLMIVVFLVWRNIASSSHCIINALKYFSAGILSGVCVLLEYSMIVIVPFVFVYICLSCRSIKKIIYYLAGIIPMALIFCVYHLHAFDSIFKTGYHFRLRHIGGPAMGLEWFDFSRFLIILFSIKAGLFIYVPALFVSVLGLRESLRRNIFSKELLLLVLLPSASYIIFYSCYTVGYIPGGESLGPRLMLPLFPLIMLPFPLGLKIIQKRLLIVLLFLSFTSAYLSAQSFFIPSDVFPILYVLKDFFVSLGASELFSRDLPLLAGLDTPLSVTKSGGIFSSLISEPVRTLKLFINQLLFTGVQAVLIVGVWYCFLQKEFWGKYVRNR